MDGEEKERKEGIQRMDKKKKIKKGAETAHNVAYRPSDRFARISVYKRGVHINSLCIYIYIYLFPSMQRRQRNWSPVRNREKEREKEIVISSRLGCGQSRVAIRDFSGYQQVRIKGEKDTKRSNSSREAAAPGYEARWWGFRVTGETGGVTRPCQWPVEIALTRKEIRHCPRVR